MLFKRKGNWCAALPSTGLLLAASTITVQASPIHDVSKAEQLVTLVIQPLTCVVRKPGDTCQMTIKAKWQSNKPIDACFYQDERQLLCWQQKDIAEQQFDVSLKSDMAFYLKLINGDVIAKQQVQVNSSSSAQYRRRLRAQWSLF